MVNFSVVAFRIQLVIDRNDKQNVAFALPHLELLGRCQLKM